MTELRGGQLGPDGRRHETPEWVEQREALWSLQVAASGLRNYLTLPPDERLGGEIHVRLVAEEMRRLSFTSFFNPLDQLLKAYDAAIARQSRIVWWEDDE